MSDKMPTNSSSRKKKPKKKSFLSKLFVNITKRRNSNLDEESSDEEMTSTRRGKNTPGKTDEQQVQPTCPKLIDDKGLAQVTTIETTTTTTTDERSKKEDTPVRPPRIREIESAQIPGSDKHLDAKISFLETPSKVLKLNETLSGNLLDKINTDDNTNSKIKSVDDVIKVLNDDKISDIKESKKLLIKEKKSYELHSDSDESDTSEYEDDVDYDNDLTDDELNMDLKDLYYTKGKYITYFFLEIERQYYNPSKETYSYIHYHSAQDKHHHHNNKVDQSSTESASPCISAQTRHKLLHRRSADNLFINSPSNSLQHSSPESIKSVPLRLKPRSTSSDTLARKKDRHLDGASMDSLAKQSLLAAQVLNLIPTQKARERNFLHGRIAANSLLGPVELERVLPNRELKIFIGTWNMNGQSPPKELNDFMLPSEIQTVPDILAIGTQESCSERSEWEAALQETVGPSHVLLTSIGLGTLHLALFLRRDLIWFVSVPEEDSFSTRPGTAFRTKGAVALAFMLFGTSFLFVTAHLTAHQDKVKERVSDIKRIVRNLELPKDLPTKHKSKDVTQNFDCVFWCGDLNFRLAQPREEVIQWVSQMCFPQESPISLAKDQLQMILSDGSVLRGFEEAPITFPPTYKYDPGTQTFDSSSKQRTPAYTDRILFKGKGHTKGYIRRVSHESTNSYKDGNIECLVYDSVPSICTSDHKPVWGVFKTTVRPGIDTIPLAAGLFNREIYLEGIKRRAAAMDDSQSSSNVCSLQ